MRFGWAKEYADGALGSGTAALFEPGGCGDGEGHQHVRREGGEPEDVDGDLTAEERVRRGEGGQLLDRLGQIRPAGSRRAIEALDLEHRLKQRRSVGRTKENDLSLEDPSVSKIHAALILNSENQLMVADTGSTNGTHVNGQLATWEVASQAKAAGVRFLRGTTAQGVGVSGRVSDSGDGTLDLDGPDPLRLEAEGEQAEGKLHGGLLGSGDGHGAAVSSFHARWPASPTHQKRAPARAASNRLRRTRRRLP